MASSKSASPLRVLSSVLALALVAGAGAASAAFAQSPGFPRIPTWVMAGAWQDSSALRPNVCAGLLGARADSLAPRARTVTVRFLRDRLAEAREDFGGYRIYRVVNTPDTTQMVLLRRYSLNPGQEPSWNFSRLDPSTMQYRCGAAVAHDSVVTFVDPDSSGAFIKVCRRVDEFDRCLSVGDSVWKQIIPPGPHDGFRYWYAVVYEAYNVTDNNFEELFVPDTLDGFARCANPANRATCPNLNNRLANMVGIEVEPTVGPRPNLETVSVVPNPFRAAEAWDRPDGNEIHFINLPGTALIRIYTVAGELVRELRHDDTIRDFARWDLKNADGRDVASGVYMYRVESGVFSAQNRFVVIR